MDLEAGWPKLDAIVKYLCPIFQGKPQLTEITTINMYLLIEIRHNILIQCTGIYIEVKKIQSYA